MGRLMPQTADGRLADRVFGAAYRRLSAEHRLRFRIAVCRRWLAAGARPPVGVPDADYYRRMTEEKLRQDEQRLRRLLER